MGEWVIVTSSMHRLVFHNKWKLSALGEPKLMVPNVECMPHKGGGVQFENELLKVNFFSSESVNISVW